MSRFYHISNPSYKMRPSSKVDWASNIESIIRITQHNLAGIIILLAKVVEMQGNL